MKQSDYLAAYLASYYIRHIFMRSVGGAIHLYDFLVAYTDMNHAK
jgi:hypothetical protein